MSVRWGSYFLLACALALTGACGAESPVVDGDPVGADDDADDDSADDDAEDDDSAEGDDDEPPPEDDDPDPPVTPPKDASVPRLDSSTGTTDAASARDTGSARSDAATDAGSASDAASSGDSGPNPNNGGKKGECCDDGDCLCHGPKPSALTSARGPFKTAEMRIAAGTVTYPTDAEPPFAAVAVCGGFLNTGPEMAPWAPFYASHGIVTVIVSTAGSDVPQIRSQKLLTAIEQLKQENTKSGSPLFGKLAGRYGTSGYSMGGGGTSIAASMNASLKTSIGLAPWQGTGSNTKVASLMLCGSSDTTAPCSMSQSIYRGIPEGTPKMMISINGSTHFNWFGPTDAGRGTSGSYALAFQKVYLEGDTRWKELLLTKPSNGTVTTNIQ